MKIQKAFPNWHRSMESALWIPVNAMLQVGYWFAEALKKVQITESRWQFFCIYIMGASGLRVILRGHGAWGKIRMYVFLCSWAAYRQYQVEMNVWVAFREVKWLPEGNQTGPLEAKAGCWERPRLLFCFEPLGISKMQKSQRKRVIAISTGCQ